MLKKIILALALFLLTIQLGYSAGTEISRSKEELSHYLNDRIQTSDKRYASFLLALQLLEKCSGKTIVETGTARYGNQQFVGDGGSTIIFGNWAAQHHAMLYSVDHAPSSIENAKNVTKDYAEHIQFCCYDSVQFLKEYSQLIDFLYLDSYEYDVNHPTLSQTHHLNELIAAYPCLHEKSIVMIDDCDLSGGGQGKLVIEFLTDCGWRVAYNGCQTILTQN